MTKDSRGTGEARKIRVAALPRSPKNLEDTGLPTGFLVELACKMIYFGGVMTLGSLSEKIALPVSVVSDVVEFMKKERLVELKKGADLRASYSYAVTDLGRERARDYLMLSGYVGAAPVTLQQYTEISRKQTVRKMAVTREMMTRAFQGVILVPGLLDRLGPAVNSGRSVSCLPPLSVNVYISLSTTSVPAPMPRANSCVASNMGTSMRSKPANSARRRARART